MAFALPDIADAKALSDPLQGDELDHIAVRIMEIDLPPLEHPFLAVLFEEDLYAIGSQLGNGSAVCIRVDADE